VIVNTLKLIAYTGIASRLTRVPKCVALITGLGVTFSPPRGFRSQLIHRSARILLKVGLSQCSVVVFHNPDDRHTLEGMRLLDPSHKTAIVDGSGVDLEHFTPSPVPTDPVSFLFMGRLIRSKGALDFIDAALTVKASKPAARFQMLGDLDAQHPESIGREQLERAQRGGIEYLGSQRDVRPYLNASTVVVVPSQHREGLPRTILEAFATGRPVIASDVPGCRHAVQPDSGWLVPPRSPDALAARMFQIIDAPEQAIALGPVCRALAERRFGVERVTQQLINAINA